MSQKIIFGTSRAGMFLTYVPSTILKTSMSATGDVILAFNVIYELFTWSNKLVLWR
jgi:hypothetical protein